MRNNIKLFCLFFGILATVIVSASFRKVDSHIRIITYNLADGMWSGQECDYSNFVHWFKSQDVDVALLCETGTHWDRNKKGIPRNAYRYLPDSLGKVAARWGHPYCVVGTAKDDYPVAVTSKHPIELIQRIDDDIMSHGAMHVKIKGINYVVLHLWPQRFKLHSKDRKDMGGDSTRLAEIKNILNLTLFSPKFCREKDWVIAGDFNSVSPLDSAHYFSGREDVDRYTSRTGHRKDFTVQRYMLSTGLNDIVKKIHPEGFISSKNEGPVRIDFVYGSDKILKKTREASIIADDFTKISSDHRPVLLVLNK